MHGLPPPPFFCLVGAHTDAIALRGSHPTHDCGGRERDPLPSATGILSQVLKLTLKLSSVPLESDVKETHAVRELLLHVGGLALRDEAWYQFSAHFRCAIGAV